MTPKSAAVVALFLFALTSTVEAEVTTEACDRCVAAQSCDTLMTACRSDCERAAEGGGAPSACHDACASELNACVRHAKAECGACEIAKTEPVQSAPLENAAAREEDASVATTNPSTDDAKKLETAVAIEAPAAQAEPGNENTTENSATLTVESTPSEPAAPAPLPTDTNPAEAAPTPVVVAAGSESIEKQKSAVPVLGSKGAVVKERERNIAMLTAIRDGNLKAIRRLIEVEGLNPTFVYSHDFNPESRQYEGKIVRLRLNDILSDTNLLRSEAGGLDRVLALFIELGTDVKASVNRTAAWPSLKFMETAKDRDARIRAFDIALAAGLPPTEDVGEWIFAELPQVCGRDRSKFAIQVMDILVKHQGAALKEEFRRNGETLSSLLDRSYSQSSAPKTAYEKEQFAAQDQVWENCAPLSRRINRYLTQGN